MTDARPMETPEHTLSIREKLGYSLGDLAANLIFQTLITYLAFFYTDVYRLPPATAAPIIFVIGVLGAFVFTPLIGIAAAPDFTVLLNHPVGRARLAVNLEQFVQIRVGNGVAFIGGQAVFSGNFADNAGNCGVIIGRNSAQRCRDGGNGTHSELMT